MIRRQLSVLCAFLLVGAGLAYGLQRLFTLRMTRGDVYPLYSTLRPDPLGAKALLEALNGIPGLRATQNFEPLKHLLVDRPVGLFYIGISRHAMWEEGEVEHFEGMISHGSRGVFAFLPEGPAAPKKELKLEDPKAKPKASPAGSPVGKGEKPEKPEEKLPKAGTPFSEAARQWGFAFELMKLEKGLPLPSEATLEASHPGLEATIPWHSALYFNEVAPDWSVLYRVAEKPVVMERRWGRGSIVVATDPFFLSNEALRGKERAPKLLATLVGSQHELVFDEQHLGVEETQGVATLARKYGLHGVVAGLGLLAALFVWQNMVRFLPPDEAEKEAGAVISGRGSSEGFLALLRRSVPPTQLIPTCLAEWRRTAPAEGQAAERLTAADPGPNAPRKASEIVATYRALWQSQQHPSRRPRP